MVKVKKPDRKDSFKELAEKARGINEFNDDCLTISLRHFDNNQGQKFVEWDSEHILADALETIKGYSSQPPSKQFNDRFKIYGGFPPSDKTIFKHPKHVPADAKWTSMHVSGKRCLIGHLVKNTFFLVFLDKEHEFWKSELKNT